MSSQRYEPISSRDDDDHVEGPPRVPSSPPPPFTSRPASPTQQHLLARHDPLASDADQTLADTFNSPSDDDGSDEDEEHEEHDDRSRLVRSGTDNAASRFGNTQTPVETRVSQYPVAVPTTTRLYGSGRANDGVFANLSAKPSRGEEADEKPPSYEQAAADATPPYWETTILAPGMLSDEVYVDGLPVGSVFSFVWNAMISMSFQIVGFLLTYLLHTTHAAKNGSRAGLGITLVQYGFSMKGASSVKSDPTGLPSDTSGQFTGQPNDPNAHDFDPAKEGGEGSFDQGMAGLGGISTTDWFAYILMVVGWFILIRALSDFLRARRHEQLVLQSPDRGLGIAVVAEGEQPESTV